MHSPITARSLLLAGSLAAVTAFSAALPAATASAAAPEPPDPPAAPADLDVPDADDIAEHRTYDPGPELQRTPGGSLIVDAFIMDGPVRVAIRHRESGELLLEQESDTLFSFEVSRPDLGAEPEAVVVRIFVDGELAHELTLDR